MSWTEVSYECHKLPTVCKIIQVLTILVSYLDTWDIQPLFNFGSKGGFTRKYLKELYSPIKIFTLGTQPFLEFSTDLIRLLKYAGKRPIGSVFFEVTKWLLTAFL